MLPQRRRSDVKLHAFRLAGLVGLSGLAVARARASDDPIEYRHLPLEEMLRTGESLATPRGCPSRHVEKLDGRCDESWSVDTVSDYDYYDQHFPRAIKPAFPVEPLCQVDPAMIERLQRLVADLPAEAWNKPQAKFSEFNKLDYDQAVFHFPINRSEFSGRYYIFKYASWVHDWIEPFLLNITRRYNYSDEPVPQHEGYLAKSIPRLFLARLAPQQRQRKHSDLGGSSRAPHKIHVPVSGEGQASLATKAGRGHFVAYSMPVGFAYEVNNRMAHFAVNDGGETRIHLIFEYLPLDLGSNWTDAIAPEDRPGVKRKKMMEAAQAKAEL